jgi:hypothetical protein
MLSRNDIMGARYYRASHLGDKSVKGLDALGKASILHVSCQIFSVMHALCFPCGQLSTSPHMPLYRLSWDRIRNVPDRMLKRHETCKDRRATTDVDDDLLLCHMP